jgi:hypothetical protein
MVVDETFQVYSGPSTTDGDVVSYGTLDGWFKAADEGTAKELYKFHAPSGILGNPVIYKYKGTKYVAVLSSFGGWAAIGLAAGLTKAPKASVQQGLPRRLPTIPISAERCWCFRCSLAIADLDPANSANVVCTARDSLGTSIPNEVSVPVLNPLAHWAGASLIKFGASIRHDDPALVRLARGQPWRLFPNWCIEPPDGARVESDLGSCHNLANGRQQRIFAPCFRPPNTHPGPKSALE